MLYRAVALNMFRFGGDPASEFEAVRACEGVAQVDPTDPELRSEVVGSIASRISAYPGCARRCSNGSAILRAGGGRGARRPRHRHGDRAGCHRQAVRHRLARSARPPAGRRLLARGMPAHLDDVLIDIRARDARDSRPRGGAAGAGRGRRPARHQRDGRSTRRSPRRSSWSKRKLAALA